MDKKEIEALLKIIKSQKRIEKKLDELTEALNLIIKILEMVVNKK